MISAISNVSFCGEGSPDLINAPGKFSAQPTIINTPADSFSRLDDGKKKSNSGWKAALGVAIVALAAFAGLGYAVKSGNLSKVDLEQTEGFFNKAWGRIKNAGHWVGEKAQNCYEGIVGLFKKEAKNTNPTT